MPALFAAGNSFTLLQNKTAVVFTKNTLLPLLLLSLPGRINL